MHNDLITRGLFSKIMLNKQMTAYAFDIDHSEGSAFTEGACRAMAPASTLGSPGLTR
jgi:hypothetical protein